MIYAYVNLFYFIIKPLEIKYIIVKSHILILIIFIILRLRRCYNNIFKNIYIFIINKLFKCVYQTFYFTYYIIISTTSQKLEKN